MDWLANVRIEYVIAAIVVLFIARLWLARYKTPLGKSAEPLARLADFIIARTF